MHSFSKSYFLQLLFWSFLFVANRFILQAQPMAEENYKHGKEDYLFPIKPGKQNFLSGSMGELRPGHFHAGIDIKTEGTEGLPVYATADGYIYRVRVSPRGYGRALYLQHDNGTKSLYGHLKKFDAEIEKYVLAKHYELQKSSVDVYPQKNRFRFKKGQIIAYSGNTGSSGGPHLHFEIRQPNDAVVNPLKFNLTEIRDNIAPNATRIALVTRGENSRINGTFGRLELPLYRNGRVYRNNAKLKVHGAIGVEFQGVDRANMTSNTYGISKVVMEVNGQKIYEHEIDLIPFEISRMINLFTNYKVWQEKNRRFQRCYKVDGNKLPFYETSPSNGFFVVPDSGTYQLTIHLYDAYQNHSIIALQLEGATANELPSYPTASTDQQGILENVYTFSAKAPVSEFHIKGDKFEKDADYQLNGLNYFSWDLRLGLPDSIVNENEVFKTNLIHTFLPFSNTTFFNNNTTINIPSGAISDTLYFTLDKKDDIYYLGEENFPLFKRVSFTIQPDEAHQDQSYKVYRLNSRNKPSFVGGVWQGNKITFSTRSFGRFVLLKDGVKPSIRVLRNDAQKVVCRIDDTLSGIKDFKASINGNWLLMLYDYRRKLIWSEKKNAAIPLKGDLKLEVTDEAGNQRIYRARL